MNEFNIPMLAYVFVGVTSMVLAYVTYSESEDGKYIEPVPASTPLPAIFSSDTSNSNSYEEEEESEDQEQGNMLPTFGGKSKKSKKSKAKKTKSKKTKSKKNKTKHAHKKN